MPNISSGLSTFEIMLEYVKLLVPRRGTSDNSFLSSPEKSSSAIWFLAVSFSREFATGEENYTQNIVDGE